MKHYPASRTPARLAGLDVSPKPSPTMRRIAVLIGLSLFAAGFAAGCLTSAFAALP